MFSILWRYCHIYFQIFLILLIILVINGSYDEFFVSISVMILILIIPHLMLSRYISLLRVRWLVLFYVDSNLKIPWPFPLFFMFIEAKIDNSISSLLKQYRVVLRRFFKLSEVYDYGKHLWWYGIHFYVYVLRLWVHCMYLYL